MHDHLGKRKHEPENHLEISRASVSTAGVWTSLSLQFQRAGLTPRVFGGVVSTSVGLESGATSLLGLEDRPMN
jgi:hypothetical protein